MAAVTTLMPPYIHDDLDPAVRGDALVWDVGEPAPAGLGEVDFFVLPYMAGPDELGILADLPSLRVIQALSAGVDNLLDVVAPPVTLCNAAGVHDASTSEFAVALTLASLRHLDDFARAMPEGRWIPDRFDSLADRQVLLVGFGSIGRAIARRLAPFECHVTAVARTARTQDGVEVHALAELPSLLPQAEVVIVIVPLTDETRGLVDEQFLDRMRPGALLVNVSRGPVVDADALLRATAGGHVRAALDVTDPEPLPADHALWRTPGVLISPHVAGNTSAFLPRARRLVAAQLTRWRAGEPLANVVRSS